MTNLTSDQFLVGGIAKPLTSDTFLGGEKATPYNPKPAPISLENKLRSQLGGGTAAEMVGGVNKIIGSVQAGAESMKGTPLDFSQGKDYYKSFTPTKVANAVIGAGQAGAGAVTGAAQVALSPVTSAIQKSIPIALEAFKLTHPNIAKAYDFLSKRPETKQIADALLSKAGEVSQNLDPRTKTLVGDLVNTALLAFGGGNIKLAVPNIVKEAFTKEAVQGVKQGVKESLIKDASTKAIKNITPAIDEVKDATLKQVLKTVDPETTFSKGKINLSPNLNKTALENKELLQGNPTENYQAVVKKSSDLFKETNDLVKGKTFSPTSLEKNIESSASKIKPPSTISSSDWNKKIKEVVTNIIEQNKGGDASTLRQYILDYRKENQGALDALFGGKEKSANKLIDSIENSMNDTLAEGNPKYAANVKKMKDLKQLSDWLQPISESSSQKSILGGFINKYKVPISIGGSIAAGATGIPQKIIKATTGISLP